MKVALKPDNRLLMPESTAFVDLMKDVFGADQVKVIYAEENGIKVESSESRKVYQEFPA